MLYIGSTALPLRQRVGQHVRMARRWFAGGSEFCAAYDIVKDGRGTFQFDVLEYLYHCTIRDLRQAEQRHYLEACNAQQLTVINKCRPSRPEEVALNSKKYSSVGVPCPYCGKVLTSCNLYRHEELLHGG